MKVLKYPEIGAYRNAIYEVTNVTRYFGKDGNGDPIYNDNILPIIKYRFTPKGHGTSCAIIWAYNLESQIYEPYTQSRERIITPISDNHGFSTFIYKINFEILYEKLVIALLSEIVGIEYYQKRNEDGTFLPISRPTVQIYGEWSGKGIQKKVAISEVDKFFMVFGVKVNGVWVPDEILKNVKLPEERIFNVLDYKSHEIDIDFNNPGDYTKQFDKWVEEIEDECPIGLALGVEKGIGEGWVGKPVDPRWHHGRYFFKIKGEKHVGKSDKTNHKVLIDVEKVNSIKELVNVIVPEGRLEQGIGKLIEGGVTVDTKATGKYLKWLYNDTMKEELDTVIQNGFEPKEISKYISTKGRVWFFNYLDKLAGL